ncbi:MAG: hypothetical protein CSA82_01110 [Actinobacteria bacterium]|nr:MAG: hypothetical protein CSA82_01110 [Actinomycetota bacterium]
MPISLATTPSTLEEERRLLYVGVTRARDFLHVSWARHKEGSAGRGNRKRSHLLDGIWPEEEPQRQVKKVSPSRKAARAQKRAVFEEENPPEVVALFDTLKKWRRDIAQELHIPPFAVFTDQTLRDIAVARPRTLKQLRIIRGVGDVKLDRHGAAVLRTIREHHLEAASADGTAVSGATGRAKPEHPHSE